MPPSKKLGKAITLAAAIVLGCVQAAASQPISGVFTYHYDNARDGQNLNESVLSPSNVNSKTFGKIFSRSVDGEVYAEPLYVNAVEIPKVGTREVVYVATEHDSVYAFDASGARAKPFWKTSFIDPEKRITTMPWRSVDSTNIFPEIGITGTPVIDQTTNTLYLSAETVDRGQVLQRLHALDIATGQEKFGGPVYITATVQGIGAGNDGNGNIDLTPQIANQRCGLALYNGIVYVAFASHGDKGLYHGWLLGYDASTLQQVSAFATTPNGLQGGIWMSGGAPMIDDEGNVFVVAGNGSFDAQSDYGDSLLKLGSAGTSSFGVIDFFTPFDQEALDALDIDFGSSGVIALPDQNTTPEHLAFTGSKEGTLYVIDRDNMGGFHAGDDSQIVQSIIGQTTHLLSTPAYFNGMVYVAGLSDNLKAFSFKNGQFSVLPVSQSSMMFQGGATPVVSADGTQNGIVWAIENAKSAVLCAFDATDLGNELYNSSTRKIRDATTTYVKFTVPTVANGRVFVGSKNRLTVFGLLRAK